MTMMTITMTTTTTTTTTTFPIIFTSQFIPSKNKCDKFNFDIYRKCKLYPG